MKLDQTLESKVFSIKMVTTIADIIVKKYIKVGIIESTDYEDTKQTLIEKYYTKKERIESIYDSRSKPETYISAVLYKMLLEILRNKNAKEKHFEDYKQKVLKNDKQHEITPEEKLILENEKKYLNRVIATFGNESNKIILFCKMFFRIKPTNFDLESYTKKTCNKELETYIQIDGSENDKDIFEKLCNLCNIVENKDNKPDAIRMYVNKTNAKLINRLNGNNRANYNEESLGLLFDMLYVEKRA
ncbi:MAG: hypothetical protein MJ211_11380 [Bacteroidales bacterium]|nr:hypothetical protein [Bacteroidales bacterium]